MSGDAKTITITEQIPSRKEVASLTIAFLVAVATTAFWTVTGADQTGIEFITGIGSFSAGSVFMALAYSIGLRCRARVF